MYRVTFYNLDHELLCWLSTPSKQEAFSIAKNVPKSIMVKVQLVAL